MYVPIVVPDVRHALLPPLALDNLPSVEVAEAWKNYSVPYHCPIGVCSLCRDSFGRTRRSSSLVHEVLTLEYFALLQKCKQFSKYFQYTGRPGVE